MSFPIVPRAIYISICLILDVWLSFSVAAVLKSNNQYRFQIANPVVIGIYSIFFYCLFLLVDDKHHGLAVFFDSLYFIGTDWMSFYVFIFAIAYTEVWLSYKKPILITGCILCGLDSINLLINNFTHHMFDLYLATDSMGYFYWANDFGFIHYIHLGLCYVFVLSTFVILFITDLKAASVYKTKYRGIFIVYFIVIIANCISYSVNLSIDYSVVLYGLLAGFISYYTTYTFPKKLLVQTLKAINETISDAIVYFDFEGRCIYANKIAKQIFSENGRFCPEKAEKYCEEYIKNKESGLVPVKEDAFDLETLEINGENYFFDVYYHSEYTDGKYAGAFLKLIDKTVEYNNFRVERYNATHDALTGIMNRTGFFEAVDSYNKNHDPRERVMVCCNIKDFKLVNELFGQKMGDLVLNKVAQLLKEYCHETSMYGRLNDDKFACYIDRAFFKEKDFLDYIYTVMTLTEGAIYRMHIYVGVYEPVDSNESAQLIADKALMAISEISNDYNKVFSYYDSSCMDRLLIEKNIMSEFENAISTKQICMYLQPIIYNDGVTLGAEALCRWNHPVRGLLLPSDFLPVLEKTGLIYQLDEYIWDEAAKKLHEWSEKGVSNCYISVNVSVKDFFYTDIYKIFTNLVAVYDFKPQNLHIEITELVLMSDFSRAYSIASKLQKFGFSVAIDNFGNGYSSLNMLKDFKPQILKIDMDLHKNMENQERNTVILNSIVNMGNALDMEVIGEGVETKEQYDILHKLNCHIFQGNSLAEPMTIEEYEDKFVKYFYSQN